MNKNKQKIIVVGGGPAGMMAAIKAASFGAEVSLLEKNRELGAKLLLTGGGRCNLTNKCKPAELISRFSSTGKFLRNAFKAFNNYDLIEFFEKKGLCLKEEEGERVFPATDRAEDVLDVLLAEMGTRKIRVRYNSAVASLYAPGDIIKGVLLVGGKKLLADKVVLATGGLSYPATGSTGKGIKLAQKSGHKIIPVRPGLVWLDMFEDFSAWLEGVTLREVRLSFFVDRKKLVEGKGSIIFTSGGISGPVVLSLSGKVAYAISKGENVITEIDMCPEATIEELEKGFAAQIEKTPARTIKNVLGSLLPARLVKTLLALAEIDENKKANQMTSAERKKVIFHIKKFKMLVRRPGPIEKAMITCGGVSVKDIDPKTMASKKIKGLFFAGEMIDVDADTGGFNLQAAFSTGYLAGMSAAQT